jgi:DDE superfamily endonuclease
MPRAHGYSLEGTRCYDTHNWQARGRTNAIGALIGKHLATVSLFDANVNADVLHVWVTQDLLPKLPSRCIIVMDNATFHKRRDCQDAIHNAGRTLFYLPPYSPDLNPIEHEWAQAKTLRRKVQCSIDMLFNQYAI